MKQLVTDKSSITNSFLVPVADPSLTMILTNVIFESFLVSHRENNLNLLKVTGFQEAKLQITDKLSCQALLTLDSHPCFQSLVINYGSMLAAPFVKPGSPALQMSAGLYGAIRPGAAADPQSNANSREAACADLRAAAPERL